MHLDGRYTRRVAQAWASVTAGVGVGSSLRGDEVPDCANDPDDAGQGELPPPYRNGRPRNGPCCRPVRTAAGREVLPYFPEVVPPDPKPVTTETGPWRIWRARPPPQAADAPRLSASERPTRGFDGSARQGPPAVHAGRGWPRALPKRLAEFSGQAGGRRYGEGRTGGLRLLVDDVRPPRAEGGRQACCAWLPPGGGFLAEKLAALGAHLSISAGLPSGLVPASTSTRLRGFPADRDVPTASPVRADSGARPRARGCTGCGRAPR